MTSQLEEVCEVIVPQRSVTNAMGVRSPRDLLRYGLLFGNASPVHPYGCHVHQGLWTMLATYRHAYRWTAPQLCWVFCPGVPSRGRQQLPFGAHADDHDVPNTSALVWYPGVAERHGDAYLAACLGQIWLDWPQWWYHESRILVLPELTIQIARYLAQGVPSSLSNIDHALGMQDTNVDNLLQIENMASPPTSFSASSSAPSNDLLIENALGWNFSGDDASEVVWVGAASSSDSEVVWVGENDVIVEDF